MRQFEMLLPARRQDHRTPRWRPTFGPLLPGLDGVIHDLSRGCDVDDIVNIAVVASRPKRDVSHVCPKPLSEVTLTSLL
jgi:hypothetical protein